MKRFFLFLFLIVSVVSYSQTKPFRFAFISDTHIGSPNGTAEEDLRRTVADINKMTDVDFVVITGDVSELGTDEEIKLAKEILDQLNVPYYIIPGNHDTGWSESGGLSFNRIFGDDKFFFTHNGVHFIGCASGPYVRMSDGHVPRDAVNWMQKILKSIPANEPVVFLNHYPLDSGLDNWYELTDMLRKNRTILALCGHGHNNRKVEAEDIPALMGRSNLRAKAIEGGYNLVDITKDSIFFTERKPVSNDEKLWRKIAVLQQPYDTLKKYQRPDFSINDQYKQVKPKWTYHSSANVISTPAVINNLVVVGNQSGLVEALDIKTGQLVWNFTTKGPIFSSPAVQKDRIVFGSADGSVYCLSENGKLLWQLKTDASVLGSPVIDQNIVYIGGSDNAFRAINMQNGKEIWKFMGLAGAVTSKPVIYKDVVVFGAWDTYLYALKKKNGELVWKWNNGSGVINYSPAAVIPVVQNNVVYIAAPDRFLSAVDAISGRTLWRTKEAVVRESIGISTDGKLIYGKTMQDTIAAFYTNKDQSKLAWKFHAGYGYEHSPSKLIEQDGKLFFGTRSGVVYSIDPQQQKINWAYKIDNSMVNTLNIIDGKRIIAATMDGKIVLLEEK